MSSRAEEAAALGKALDARHDPHDESLRHATLRDLDYLQRQVSELEQRMERMEQTMLAHVEPVCPTEPRESYADHTRRDDAGL